MNQSQHYVPQFYLRGWTTGGEGLVWVYRKGQPPRRVSIRKTGQDINFYGFTDNRAGGVRFPKSSSFMALLNKRMKV